MRTVRDIRQIIVKPVTGFCAVRTQRDIDSASEEIPYEMIPCHTVWIQGDQDFWWVKSFEPSDERVEFTFRKPYKCKVFSDFDKEGRRMAFRSDDFDGFTLECEEQ